MMDESVVDIENPNTHSRFFTRKLFFQYQNNVHTYVRNVTYNGQQYNFLAFFSEPSGKPRVTAAHNTSSTSLYLSWQSPELNTIHGEFLGYKISYRPRDVSEAKAVEIPIDNPKATVSKRGPFLHFSLRDRSYCQHFYSILKQPPLRQNRSMY